MRYQKRHPELDARADALLCSINDRLAGRPGQDFGPLGEEWLEDLRARLQEEIERDQEREDEDDL